MNIPSLGASIAKQERQEQREKEEAKKKANPPKRRGRPPKKAVQAKKKPGTIGRPKGDAAIMKEYKARMLASPKSEKVIEAIYNAALDNEHKHQAAAWKLIMDRMLPVSVFEKELNAGGSKPVININVGRVGDVDIQQDNEDDFIDGDVIDG